MNKTPLICRIRARLVIPSPSARAFSCDLGLIRRIKACEKCPRNVAKRFHDAVMKAMQQTEKKLAEVMKNKKEGEEE